MIVKAHYEWDRVKGEQKTARQQAEKGFTFAVPQGDTERAMLRERIIEELSSEIPAELSNVPSAEQVAASILKHTGKRKAILKASGEMEVREEIKEHVEAIATALVDDMTKDIMDAVGRDPRIQTPEAVHQAEATAGERDHPPVPAGDERKAQGEAGPVQLCNIDHP